MPDLLLIGVPLLVVVVAWSAWTFFRGDTVGIARGLQQGEATVPGVAVRAVVKRHVSGGRPVDVELQLWTLGVARTFRLEPREALALAQALDRGVAEMRAEP